jgi:hypothetical protein
VFGRLQAGFGATPFDILVAISDRGIIETEGPRPSEVHKAESITGAIQALLKKHNNVFSINLTSGMEKYTDQEFAAIASFLAESHAPVQRSTSKAPAKAAAPNATTSDDPTTRNSNVSRKQVINAAHAADTSAPYAAPAGARPASDIPPAPPSAPQNETVPTLTCRHCNSTRLTIKYAHTYYAHCLDCAKNTPINHPPCPQCGKPTKTRKQGNQFLRTVDGCDECEWQAVFHEN